VCFFLWPAGCLPDDATVIESSPPPHTATPTIDSSVRLVAIDPGHGGEFSPGCVVGDVLEKDQNLALAFRVRDLLRQRGYRVMMLREADIDIALANRPRIAMQEGADIFISIHHNFHEDQTVEGVETWYNSEANAGNKGLAQCIQSAIVSSTEARDRGIKLSNQFIVLQGSSVPACLVEAGFLSNPEERALLLAPEYQDRIARGIAEGIDAYYRAPNG